MINLATLGSAAAALHGTPAGHLKGGAQTPPPKPSGSDRASSGNSADKTSTVTNADGSTTTTVTSAAGAVVSISTSGGTGAGLSAGSSGPGLYTTGGNTSAPVAGSAELLSLLV